MNRILFRASLVSLCLALAFSLAPGAGAQSPEPEFLPGPQVVIYANSEPSTLRIPAPDLGPQLNSAAFQIIFLPAGTVDNNFVCQTFPENARAAFQYAASIWSAYLNSAVTIRISACWADMNSSSILGSSGPYLYPYDFSGRPYPDYNYAFALADSISGTDLAPAYYDIISYFNSDFQTWYFGTDGNPPDSTWDFSSVVLHEIGHGLGMTGGARYSYFTDPPYIYDHFTENFNGTALLSLNSTDLASALTGGAYFDGPNAVAANSGSRVPLYTPTTWTPGSSYSHVAESFNGSANALMTYSLADGEVVHNPGPVVLGILKDIGWSITGSAPTAPSGLTAVTSSTTPLSQINLSWTDNSSNETGFQIERSTDGSTWSLIYTTSANATSYSNTGLATGTRYYYRVRATNSGGSSAYTNTANAVTFGLTVLAAGENRILLTWTDYSSSETGYQIERSPNGSDWTPLTITAANATSYINTGLTKSTRYCYRVYGLSITQVYSPTACATTWSSTSRVFLPIIRR